jgi:hypothetical protein
MSELTWSPVHKVLEDRIAGGDDLILLIVPFIKLDALRQLHWVRTKNVRLKVVCRWRPGDILAGASDVEAFTYLKAAGCELYLNSDIHMKLYVFESNVAFNTSANVTLRGLGYSERPNIEVGNMIALTSEDLARIFSIVTSSRQVDDAMYGRFKAFAEQNRPPTVPIMPLDLLGKTKDYTIASLPATETPAKLAEFYFAQDSAKHTPENVRRAVHDLVTFHIPTGLTKVDFDRRLGEAFRKNPFVRDFIALLKEETSLRFGVVNNWIHDKCEDVPLPYRWEIKENTRIFYDWLAHYVPEITWDRPHHSQIIHWQKSNT